MVEDIVKCEAMPIESNHHHHHHYGMPHIIVGRRLLDLSSCFDQNGHFENQLVNLNGDLETHALYVIKVDRETNRPVSITDNRTLHHQSMS